MTRHTILVIGDDPQTRQTLAALLDFDGLSVVTARDADHALEILGAGFEPCLVLLDLAPETNGAAFRRTQQADPRLSRFPVAVVSGNPDVEHEAQALGIQDFLRKPVLVDAVTAIAERHCDRHPTA